MKRYLLCGDSHGDLKYMGCIAQAAAKVVAEIICVGDWGFLWPGNDQLDELSAMLVRVGVSLRFVDGNHDDHLRLREFCNRERSDGVAIAPNVIYQPRGSVHEDEDGTRFLFLGGAPSIDRAARVEGASWWPEETITDEEFDLALSAEGPIHVLVTHDAPDYPPGFSPKGSPNYQRDQVRSMKRVDALIRRHRPALHVHGHWHTRATTYRGSTRVEALDCNQLDSSCLEDSVLLWSRE